MQIVNYYNTNKNKFIEFRKTKKWIILNYSVSLFIWIFLFVFCYFFENFSFKQPSNYYFFQILSACICGLALPFAGSSIQGVTKNDLAGPTTLGFLPLTTTSLIIYMFIDKAIPNTLNVFVEYSLCIVLSFTLLSIIYFIVKKTKRKLFLILMGLMLGIMIGAINSLLIYLFPGFLISYSSSFGNMQIWYDWNRFYASITLIIIGVLLILLMGKKINIIKTDDKTAITLGINVTRVFWISAIGSILITIGSSLLIGSIIGIAIVIPIIAKKFLYNNNFYTYSSVSSLWTSSILMLSTLLNYRYIYGINFYCMFIVMPLFILILIKRRF